MEGKRFEDIVRMLIYVQLFLASVCVGSLPCMTKTDRLGHYTVIGGSGNTSSAGVPSGSRVQVSVRCDAGAMAQQSVTSQCSNRTWIPPWPRCEKPCSVLMNIGQVRQFVNDKRMTSYYNRPTLPDGTQMVARCRDPGKYRLIGDQRRTCQGGQWTGEEPICQPVQTQVLFYGASHEVASNGTVVVHVHRGNPLNLNVLCRLTSLSLRPPRLTTPLVNDGELPQWHRLYTHKIELSPISTDFSGMYTCSGSSSSHSVHVLFKEPPKNNGSCLNSCCTSSEFSCNPEGCYCDSRCERNGNCCDDYEDVCPSLVRIKDVFISNTTYNMRGGELISVSSPYRRKNYNNLENILWHVRNVHGRRFLIMFRTVKLHSIRDYIRIYTGISDVFEESTQIFHLTYNPAGDLPDSYWSVHSNMWLQFSTDEFGTDQGFDVAIMSSILGGCDGSSFQCTNGQCIFGHRICNGFIDCVDSSDEYCESTEPSQNNGSCSNSCCTSSEYSCNPEGCYCDRWCKSNDNCCDDYEDVCPSLHTSRDVFISNTTYNMREGEIIDPLSPSYRNNYNNLENILWHVRNVQGSWFLIMFLTVGLHSIRDYVRIYTGISDVFEESTQIFHLTYNSTDDLPNYYRTVHPNMWLQLSTDEFRFPVKIMSSLLRDCDSSWFQCENGQCIYRSAVCDGFSDCVDSSDEYQCDADCEVPAAPEHGRLLDGSRQQARDIFPAGATVSFECEDDYRLVGYWQITCVKGQWSDDPPVCRG